MRRHTTKAARAGPLLPGPPLRPTYTFGYARAAPEVLRMHLATTGAILVDVRLKPFSRQPGWSRTQLVKTYGDRYRWVPDLGNLNYKGGPTKLADERRGLDFVRAILETDPVCLLCVCADVHDCHRKDVADRLEAMGSRVTHL